MEGVGVHGLFALIASTLDAYPKVRTYLRLCWMKVGEEAVPSLQNALRQVRENICPIQLGKSLSLFKMSPFALQQVDFSPFWSTASRVISSYLLQNTLYLFSFFFALKSYIALLLDFPTLHYRTYTRFPCVTTGQDFTSAYTWPYATLSLKFLSIFDLKYFICPGLRLLLFHHIVDNVD